MFRLTKTERNDRDEHVANIEMAGVDLQRAIDEFNTDLEAMLEKVNEAVEKYNSTLEEARGFAEDVAARMRDEYDEKSEKWQEGERGQAAQELIDEWENIDLDAVEPFEVELLEEPDLAHRDMLEEIRDEVE